MFKLNPDGSGFSVLHAFNYEGHSPEGGVIQGADGALYGTTSQSYSGGSVFKLNPDGTDFNVLHVFTSSEGNVPRAGLVQGANGSLYGTTSQGGSYGYGTVFKLNPDGSGFSVLHNFTSTDGTNPEAGVIIGADGVLYGTTITGGSYGYGTVFKLNLDGSGFAVLYNFTSITLVGFPEAGLIQGIDGVLYGTTSWGGSQNAGMVFKLNTDGSGFAVLHNFTSLDDGSNPQAGMIQGMDGALYGTTQGNTGTVFKLNTDGSGFINLHNFISSEGYHPEAGVIQGVDGALYGTTIDGGSSDNGTVFKLNTDGSGFTALHSFSPSEGHLPRAGLIQSVDGVLYGTTVDGGSHGDGTLFKLNPDGSGFSTLRDFIWNEGALPRDLIQSIDGDLYGTTSHGGSGNVGTVFKLHPDGSGFAILHVFTYSEGYYPQAGVIQGSDGALYGTTRDGGFALAGTVFKLNPDGSGFAILHTFNTLEGRHPRAGLIQGTDGALYGTTAEDGLSTLSTVFKLNPDGSGFATLHTFTSGEGYYPQARLIQGVDGALYGTTSQGGRNGGGTIFKLNLDGTGFATLYDLSYSEGAYPQTGLLQGADGALYGTALRGGNSGGSGGGIIFRLTDITAGTLPVANAGVDKAAYIGDVVTLDGRGSLDPEVGPSPLSYNWIQTSGPSITLTGANTAQPSFTPEIPGKYIFSLVVNDGLVNSDPDSVTVTAITNIPIAHAGPNETVNVGTLVTLNGTSSWDPDNGPLPLTYNWTQTNGPTVFLTGANTTQPSFTPAIPGTYIFSLIVNDGQTNSPADTVTVIVNASPIADAGPDQALNVGTLVTLNGSNSSDPDNGPSSLNYTWTQTGGPAVSLTGADTAQPSFTPTIAGTYVFSLVVNDNSANSIADTVTVSVNAIPIANAGLDQTVNTSILITLNGSTSTDPDNSPSPLTYNWTQTSGPSVTLTGATTAQPSFTSLTPGTYIFSLVVNDGLANSSSDTITVTVIANIAPTANAGPDETVNAGILVTLDGTGSADPDNAPSPLIYKWTQTSGPSVDLTGAMTAQSRFTPLTPGTYVFSLVVNDGAASSIADSVTVSVNAIPTANAGIDQSLHAGALVILNGTGSADPDNGPLPLTYQWMQTSGPTVALIGAATAQPSFTPSTIGAYVFSLVVSDGQASSTADSVSVIVTPVPNKGPTAHAGTDQTVNAGILVTLNGSASSDPDNGPSPLTYHWTQTSGPSVALTGAMTAQPSFTPLTPGTYVFTLVVNDGAVSSLADTVTVTVNDADYLVIQSPNNGEIWNEKSKQTITWVSHHLNSSLRMQLYLSIDGGSTWQLIASPRDLGYKTWSIPKNRYVTQQALLKICVKQNPTLCDVSDRTFTINDKPVAEAGVKQKVLVGGQVSLDGSLSYDADKGPLNLHYYWTQVSGPVPVTLDDPSSPKPSFTPPVKGSYKFSLIVNDGAADSKQDKVTVNVVNTL